MEITITEVSYKYAIGTPFERLALEGVNLTIPQGQFIAFMGQTGSGKTTLAQLINGLLRPTSGQVQIGTYTIEQKKQDLRMLRAKIGYAFQYPEHQLFEETVYKDIAFSLKQQELPDELIETRVKNAMKLVGLSYEDIKDRSPFQLSGGQMRRVALAGVIASVPEVLILDEPTAGLDPMGRQELLSLVRKLHQEQGLTIIYITHHLEEALENADRILFLNRGRIYADLYPSEVASNLSHLTKAGILSTPLLRMVSHLNQNMNAGIPESVYREDQLVEHLLLRKEGVQ